MLTLHIIIYPAGDNQTPATLTKDQLFCFFIHHLPSIRHPAGTSHLRPAASRLTSNRCFVKSKVSPHQFGARQFFGHRHIYDGHLGVSGVGFSHAVAGTAAGGNQRFDLHSFTTLHRAERKVFLLIVRFDFKKEQPDREREKQRSAHGQREFGSCDAFKTYN